MLYNIFSYLDDEDFYDVQLTCRSWYKPGHISLLRKVALSSPECVEKFIEHFEADPTPAYINAVKSITIYSWEDSERPEPYSLSKENTEKLFCFPNLQEVDFVGDNQTFVNNFDDEICKQILQTCPKLKKFKWVACRPTAKQLIKLRHVLTRLVIQDVNSSFGTLTEFINKFTNLKVLKINEPNGLDTFQKMLPIIHKSTLTELSFYLTKGDVDNFLNRYLNMKPKAEKAQLKDKLSNIVRLELDGCRNLNRNAYNLISNYMPMLTHLEVRSNDDMDWVDREIDFFCGNMLDLIPLVKNSCRLGHQMNTEVFAKCLPAIIQKVYRQIPDGCRREMELVIKHHPDIFYEEGLVYLNLSVWQKRRLIEIVPDHYTPLHELMADCFLETGPINEIDSFQFYIRKNYSGPDIDLEMDFLTFENILAKMPLLREVYLEVPKTFVDEFSECDRMNEAVTLPFVEKACIKASSDIRIQTLLDGSRSLFPNLKELSFYYYCGLWRPTMGEFQLDLPTHSLERLKVDVTTVRMESLIAGIVKGTYDEPLEGFFVLEVELLSSSVRHSYKVLFSDLSYTKLRSNSLKNLTRGKDYLRMHITAHTLKRIDLIMNYNDYNTNRKDNYLICGFGYRRLNYIVKIDIPAS